MITTVYLRLRLRFTEDYLPFSLIFVQEWGSDQKTFRLQHKEHSNGRRGGSLDENKRRRNVRNSRSRGPLKALTNLLKIYKSVQFIISVFVFRFTCSFSTSLSTERRQIKITNYLLYDCVVHHTVPTRSTVTCLVKWSNLESN